MLLPGYIADALWYRKLAHAQSCFLNADAQKEWSNTVQFIVYVLPEITVLAIYPYIWYRQKKRKKLRAPKVAPSDISNAIGAVTAASDIVSRDPGETNHSTGGENIRGRKPSSNAFTVLTLLTASVFLTWTPQTMYYSILSLVAIESATTFEVTNILFNVQPILNPILFTAAL